MRRTLGREMTKEIVNIVIKVTLRCIVFIFRIKYLIKEHHV